MLQARTLPGALLRFAVIFGLLILPWPGWNQAYAAYFRALGQFVFDRPNGSQIVRFEPYHEQHGFSALDSRLLLANRTQVDADGNGPASMIDLDTRSVGWVPTALTLALILATPVPWRQRGLALFGGLLLIQAFILFSLQVWIWDESSSLSLLQLSSFSQTILDNLQYTLLTQLGASFSVPVLIWILVTVRRENLFGLLSAKATSP